MLVYTSLGSLERFKMFSVLFMVAHKLLMSVEILGGFSKVTLKLTVRSCTDLGSEGFGTFVIRFLVALLASSKRSVVVSVLINFNKGACVLN
jgi:hypothetical protein